MSADRAVAAAAHAPKDPLESVYAQIRGGEGNEVQSLTSSQVIEKFGDKKKLGAFLEKHDGVFGKVAGDELRALVAQKLVEDGIVTADDFKNKGRETQALVSALKTLSYNLFDDSLDVMLKHLDSTR